MPDLYFPVFLKYSCSYKTLAVRLNPSLHPSSSPSWRAFCPLSLAVPLPFNDDFAFWLMVLFSVLSGVHPEWPQQPSEWVTAHPGLLVPWSLHLQLPAFLPHGHQPQSYVAQSSQSVVQGVAAPEYLGGLRKHRFQGQLLSSIESHVLKKEPRNLHFNNPPRGSLGKVNFEIHCAKLSLVKNYPTFQLNNSEITFSSQALLSFQIIFSIIPFAVLAISRTFFLFRILSLHGLSPNFTSLSLA